MDIAITPAIERVAHVLAAQRLSVNAKGEQSSASPQIDGAWPDHRDDATAVLKTLREHDTSMAEAGDAAIWERMILAAICQAAPDEPPAYAQEPPEPGTPPLHEGPQAGGKHGSKSG